MAAAFKGGLAIGSAGYSAGHVMHTKQAMATGNKCHARMIKSVAGGVVADGIPAVDDGLEELDALPIDAAHAGERDGVVDVAASEYSRKMAVLVALAVSLRPDDEVRLVRVLDDDSVKSYPRVVLHDLDEAVRLGVARWHRTWNGRASC